MSESTPNNPLAMTAVTARLYEVVKVICSKPPVSQPLLKAVEDNDLSFYGSDKSFNKNSLPYLMIELSLNAPTDKNTLTVRMTLDSFLKVEEDFGLAKWTDFDHEYLLLTCSRSTITP